MDAGCETMGWGLLNFSLVFKRTTGKLEAACCSCSWAMSSGVAVNEWGKPNDSNNGIVAFPVARCWVAVSPGAPRQDTTKIAGISEATSNEPRSLEHSNNPLFCMYKIGVFPASHAPAVIPTDSLSFVAGKWSSSLSWSLAAINSRNSPHGSPVTKSEPKRYFSSRSKASPDKSISLFSGIWVYSSVLLIH